MILKGIQLPLSIELRDGVHRIGRHPDNDVQIPDPSISSFHCEIHVSGESVVVRDLGSTNGTFIENQPVAKEGLLNPGGSLRLGSVDFRLEPDTSAAPLPHVAIPVMEVAQPKTHGFLEDGSPACLNHDDIAARYQCTKCSETFCVHCVRTLAVVKTRRMVFCPACDGQCAVIATGKRSKKSFFGRLAKTLKLPFGQ